MWTLVAKTAFVEPLWLDSYYNYMKEQKYEEPVADVNDMVGDEEYDNLCEALTAYRRYLGLPSMYNKLDFDKFHWAKIFRII